MDESELHRAKRAEVDIWTGLLQRRTRELASQGMPLEQAEEQAAAEIRRDIRRS